MHENVGWHLKCWVGTWDLGVVRGLAVGALCSVVRGAFYGWSIAASLGASLHSSGCAALGWRIVASGNVVVVAPCCAYGEISFTRAVVCKEIPYNTVRWAAHVEAGSCCSYNRVVVEWSCVKSHTHGHPSQGRHLLFLKHRHGEGGCGYLQCSM